MPGKGKGWDKSVPIKSQQEVIGFLGEGLFSFLNLLGFHLLFALLFRGLNHGSYLCCALLAANTADTFQALLRNAIDHQFEEEPDSKQTYHQVHQQLQVGLHTCSPLNQVVMLEQKQDIHHHQTSHVHHLQCQYCLGLMAVQEILEAQGE